MKTRIVIVVGGPSGVGKDTFMRAALARYPGMLTHGLLTTTRSPRPGEVDGRDHRFLDADAFAALAREGDLFESAFYAGNWYGRQWKDLDADDCLITQEVWGFEKLRSAFAVTAVLIAPPSIDELARRLRERGMHEGEEFRARLDSARSELARRALYDHCVVNDQLERSLDAFFSIVESVVS